MGGSEMNRDDIIRMAQDAGMGVQYYQKNDGALVPEVWGGPSQTKIIERFAALVAAAEREACARLAEECVNIERLADDIRARGE